MNNSESPSTERMIAGPLGLLDKHRLHDVSTHFPSYLRLFGIFFGLLISELHCGAAQALAGCWGRFPAAQAHVAFL